MSRAHFALVMLVALSAFLAGVISGYVIHGDSDDSHDPVEAESAVSDGLDCQAAVAYYEAVFATHQAYGDTQEQRKLQVEYWEDVIVPAGNQMEDACTQ